MASLPTPLISAELKQIIDAKREELLQLKALCTSKSNLDLTDATRVDLRQKVTELLEEIKKTRPDLEYDDDIASIERFLEQTANDRSIPDSKLRGFARNLEQRLTHQFNRLEAVELHVKLLQECLQENGSPKTPSTLDDEYELVEEDHVQQAREKFGKRVFTSNDTDPEQIRAYLAKIFAGDAREKVLSKLREAVEDLGNSSYAWEELIDEDGIDWCIKDILKSQFISVDKEKILRGYLQSSTTIRELKTTLKLKASMIRQWNWRNPEKGLQVVARQNHKGDTCMVVDEDIIDLLFLHSISTTWSAKLERELMSVARSHDMLHLSEQPSNAEIDKRAYYLAPARLPSKSKGKRSTCDVCHPLPPPPPPPPPFPGCVVPPPPPPPSPPLPGRRSRWKNCDFFYVSHRLDEQRHEDHVDNFLLGCLPRREGSRSDEHITFNEPHEQQVNLIKTLTTEMHFRKALDGQFALLKADYEAFATSLPHSTIIAVLEFIGVPRFCLDFFRKFLEAPLNMGANSGTGANQVRTRKCGLPIGHGLSRLFGELILFLQDIAIHQESKLFNYRIRDQSYFIGSPDMIDAALQAMENFKSAMGLSLKYTKYSCIPDQSVMDIRTNNNTECGRPIPAVSVGLLDILPGDLRWKINDNKLQAYIASVSKQLNESKTVLSWIRTWNATAGTYASHLFGPLSNCMGKQHLDQVIEAYNKIHEALFPNSDIATFLKAKIESGLSHPLPSITRNLESLLYLPTSLGGLGVQDPYTTFSLATEIQPTPALRLNDYLHAERTAYEKSKAKFESLDAAARKKKLDGIYPPGEKDAQKAAAFPDGDFDTFMSFAEFIQFRERAGPHLHPWHDHSIKIPSLHECYAHLMRVPNEDIEPSSRLEEDIKRFGWWRNLSSEEKWVVQLYEDECFETYGTVKICEREWLPWEGLKIVRGTEWEEDTDLDGYDSDILDD